MFFSQDLVSEQRHKKVIITFKYLVYCNEVL